MMNPIRGSVRLALTFGLIWMAFAGAGSIRVYVYDMKTGSGVTNFTAQMTGSGGTNRNLQAKA